ncbi:hypothetical protein [Zhihengliuella sp. ISTPL4]|uniref:hypothetical protein n=1 Tax=Zhihengliuella sp. ISTPL4 TaxID=2058657 RepID=UPI0013051BD1|nr:hypothetical protein [Zhihengliuella sp. ISTPL4]
MSAHAEKPPNVSVSIRAAVGEVRRAEEVAAQLEGVPVRICRIGEGQDNGSAAVAWLPWTRRATHHLVLDAAVNPHPDFVTQVHDAVAGRPRAVLTLFTPGGSYPSHALRVAAFAGRPWLMSPPAESSTVATVLPVSEAVDFARYVACAPAGDEGALLHRFAEQRGLAVLASSPDLVQVQRAEAHAQATAFLPDVVAPADWWRRQTLLTPQRFSVVHPRDGEPVSYEALAGTTDGWRLRARRDVPTPHARRFTRVMHDRLLGTDVARSDLRAAAVLLGAAGVLRDQLLLASEVGGPPGGFGVALARESAATLPVATLGQSIPAATRADGAAELRNAFRALRDDMAEILGMPPAGPAHGADP